MEFFFPYDPKLRIHLFLFSVTYNAQNCFFLVFLITKSSLVTNFERTHVFKIWVCHGNNKNKIVTKKRFLTQKNRDKHLHITNDAKNLCKGVFKIKVRLKTSVLN